MISAKDITNVLAIKLLAYQLAHPDENDEVVGCAKTLDKILYWDEHGEDLD
jgi:hypothetical protein